MLGDWITAESREEAREGERTASKPGGRGTESEEAAPVGLDAERR